MLGEVARDFGLYTKITGGQRVDLFGARVDQLPAIWRRLVDAGFESGHAYGKALRTVKSCVGSTWCRYGVQDSVSLAIELELRYRGIRSPHKIKAGVSGCARECAEAQSKDIGVIATENGWNLYVGRQWRLPPAARRPAADRRRHRDPGPYDRPVHHVLRPHGRPVAADGRAGSRGSRAAWTTCRSVIVEDSLGIAAELDAAMARHVEAYEDEWAAVLDDPDRLRRFVSFVNAPEHARPEHLLRDRARADRAGRLAAGPGRRPALEVAR